MQCFYYVTEAYLVTTLSDEGYLTFEFHLYLQIY